MLTCARAAAQGICHGGGGNDLGPCGVESSVECCQEASRYTLIGADRNACRCGLQLCQSHNLTCDGHR